LRFAGNASVAGVSNSIGLVLIDFS
jgi:hypothetical protein